MPPTLLLPPSLSISITPEPLTREAFAPFGTAIIPPLPRYLTTPDSLPLQTSSSPSSSPSTSRNALVPNPIPANQLSALKYTPISPLTNNYPSQCPSGKPATAQMSLFSCFPRQLRTLPLPLPPSSSSQNKIKNGHGKGKGKEKVKKAFDVRILERHPFTTQTFTPLSTSSPSPPSSEEKDNGGEGEDEDEDGVRYLIIVAPTLKNQTGIATTDAGAQVTIADPPDLRAVRAFLATRDQAVTYGVGTWHAPMVVVGRRRVDFVVVQFGNGVGEEDCQEVRVGEGVVVEVPDFDADGVGDGVKARL